MWWCWRKIWNKMNRPCIMPVHRSFPYKYHQKWFSQRKGSPWEWDLVPTCRDEIEKWRIKTYLEKLSRKESVDSLCKSCEWIECKHVVKTSAIIELEKNIELLKDSMKSLRGQEKRKVHKELKKMQKALIEQCKTRRFRLEPQKFTTKTKTKISRHILIWPRL